MMDGGLTEYNVTIATIDANGRADIPIVVAVFR